MARTTIPTATGPGGGGGGRGGSVYFLAALYIVLLRYRNCMSISNKYCQCDPECLELCGTPSAR